MKDTFVLEKIGENSKMVDSAATISIIGRRPKDAPYVVLTLPLIGHHFIKDEDLILFAKNILRAMKVKL